MAQYIKIASCQVILLPSEIMGTNLKLEQVDRLFQSRAEPSQTVQIRVMNSDRDEKILDRISPAPGTEGSPRNDGDAALIPEDPEGASPRCEAMSQPRSTAAVEPSTNARAALRGTDIRRSTRRRRAHILTYLDDLDHDLTIVEYKAGFNNANIQETMQRLMVMERKILKINMVINRYLLPQEGRPLGRNTTITGGHLVETASLGLMLVIALSFVAMAVHKFGK